MNENFGKKNWFILLLFGLIGQIAWSVENMYFNLFVFEEISPSLDVITLMVQLSGIMATVVTLIAGAWSDKVGNRRSFLSWGYVIWGVTVALFGCLTPERMQAVLIVDVDTVGTVLQNKNHTGRSIFGCCGHCMKAKGCFINIRMLLCVFQQVKPEFIQTQVHDRDSAGHFLNIHYFVTKPL